MNEQVVSTSILGQAEATQETALRLELSPTAQEEQQGIHSTIFFEVMRTVWLGEGKYGRVFSGQGFVIEDGRRIPTILALKIFKPANTYIDSVPVNVTKYVRDHAELQNRGLPVLDELRVIEVGENIIGFAMTDLAANGEVVVSINEFDYFLKKIKETDPARWEVMYQMLTEPGWFDYIKDKLLVVAHQAAEQRVYVRDDSFILIVPPGGELRVLIGDLDTIAINTLERKNIADIFEKNEMHVEAVMQRLEYARQKVLTDPMYS